MNNFQELIASPKKIKPELKSKVPKTKFILNSKTSVMAPVDSDINELRKRYKVNAD
jgi:hypothetical protein